MSDQAIEAKLIEQLESLLGVDRGVVLSDSQLQAMGMNSMMFVELMIFIEKEFAVELISTDMQRSDLETPRALAASIARNL